MALSGGEEQSISRSCGCAQTSARGLKIRLLGNRGQIPQHTACPDFFFSTIRRATRLMHSASATDVPPNIITTILEGARSSRGPITRIGCPAASVLISVWSDGDEPPSET
jgi:hypothetical protein